MYMNPNPVAAARSQFWFYFSGFMGALFGLIPAFGFVNVMFLGLHLPDWLATLFYIPIALAIYTTQLFGSNSLIPDILLLTIPVLLFFFVGLLVYTLIHSIRVRLGRSL